jgi:capsid protein
MQRGFEILDREHAYRERERVTQHQRGFEKDLNSWILNTLKTLSRRFQRMLVHADPKINQCSGINFNLARRPIEYLRP